MSAGRACVRQVCLFSAWLAGPLFLANGWSQPYTINTIAGTSRLRDGGSATLAPLSGPISVAEDSNGNLYIADRLDNRIRMVTPAGIISTYAGTGIPGYSGDRGPANKAQLSDPTSIVFDSKGYLYVADRGNAVVRRIAPDGTIDTFAGRGITGFSGDNGPATSAEIDPLAITLDYKGNLYIADGYNYRIREVDLDGTITTIAGTGLFGYTGDNGPASIASIGLVTGLAADTGGNLYLADYGEAVVREIDSSGMMNTFAGVGYNNPGTTGNGFPASSTLLIPYGVAFDGISSIYISDDYLSEVDRVDLTTGFIYTVAGNGSPGFFGDKGPAIGAELYVPTGLTIAAGQIYIADLGNGRVRKVANNIITTVAGTSNGDSQPATSAFLNLPEGLAIDMAGNITVADTWNYELRRFLLGGVIGGFGEVLGQPFGVTVDQSGNFYVSDSEPLVLKVGEDGTTSIVAGNSQSGFSGDGGSAQSASLNNPLGLAVDSAGDVFIADNGNHRVRKVDTSGTIGTIAGDGKALFSGDNGPAVAAGMDPYDLALDKGGDLFVVDHLNSRIRKINGNGTITTVAGTGVPGYSGDGGPATAARLDLPTGIAIDGAGNLYIADEGNAVVRRVTANGLITTIAGNGTGTPNSGDGGLASAAQLDPRSVAVDSAGNVYVTDSFNSRVRELTPFAMTAASAAKVSGDGQSGTVSTTLAAPLVLKITDAAGAGVPGVVVVFTVSPANAATVNPSPAITLNDGTVSAMVTLGNIPGTITIQAQATGVVGVPVLSFSATALPSNAPGISAGGITSGGLSTPPVTALSPNAIVSIFGSNFAPAGTAREVGTGDLVNGQIPTNLAGVCAEFGGVRAPIFDVFPGQLNVQVPALMPGNTSVQVITNCDTPNAVASPPIDASVQAAAPEFFYFLHNADGHNPIAAVNAVTGAYVGATGLITGATFVPAQPGDILTLFATGFGATNPSFGPGVLPGKAAQVTAPFSITFGGVTLDPSDILYVGVTQDAGLYQVNLKVPSNVPAGDQPLVITIGGVASPSSAFITVQSANGS